MAALLMVRLLTAKYVSLDFGCRDSTCLREWSQKMDRETVRSLGELVREAALRVLADRGIAAEALLFEICGKGGWLTLSILEVLAAPIEICCFYLFTRTPLELTVILILVLTSPNPHPHPTSSRQVATAVARISTPTPTSS